MQSTTGIQEGRERSVTDSFAAAPFYETQKFSSSFFFLFSGKFFSFFQAADAVLYEGF
jgi:hypothetical protein